MTSRVLVCFALPGEARFFPPAARDPAPVRVLITGMGRSNAARQIQAAVTKARPDLVLTCGVAGALNPALPIGAVVYSADAEAQLGKTLAALGGIPVTFHCAPRVIITAAEKKDLRARTGADAVEMESGAIREICQQSGIPSTTIRAISDVADEDLPVDFNALMTPQLELNYLRLARTLVSSPYSIPGLLRLQRHTRLAARNLGNTLSKLLDVGLPL